MDKWGMLVEQRLQDALAKGEFANLPGKGKPLALDEEPLAEQAQWMARHILRNSGMSVPWAEERQRIGEALALATKRLECAWSAYAGDHDGGPPSPAAESRWQKALATFREDDSALNRRIRTYNLSVPHVRFQRCLIKVRREVARLRR